MGFSPFSMVWAGLFGQILSCLPDDVVEGPRPAGFPLNGCIHNYSRVWGRDKLVFRFYLYRGSPSRGQPESHPELEGG
jgi:hypothetical protein